MHLLALTTFLVGMLSLSFPSERLSLENIRKKVKVSTSFISQAQVRVENEVFIVFVY